MPDDRLLPAPDRLDRAARLPRGQRQRNLHRHILPPAERAADGRVAHDDLARGQAQGVGDLLLILVHPLTGDDHLDASVGAHVSEAGLRLQKGMFLRVRAVDTLDAQFGLGEAVRNVPAAQAMGDKQIRLPVPLFIGKAAEGVGMERTRVRCHCLVRIGNDRQRLVFDIKQPGRRLGLRRGLGHNQCHLIAFPTHDLCLRRTPRPAQHRLIRNDQPVLVHRHVRSCQNGDNAFRGRGPRRVQTDDARMGHAGEDDLQPRLIGQINVAGIGGLTGHLVRGVETGYAATDCTHQKTSVTSVTND